MSSALRQGLIENLHNADKLFEFVNIYLISVDSMLNLSRILGYKVEWTFYQVLMHKKQQTLFSIEVQFYSQNCSLNLRVSATFWRLSDNV